MMGIVLTLLAVILVICLAFCHPGPKENPLLERADRASKRRGR